MSKAREYALRRKYNLTLEQYEQILNSQKNCCGVCGRHKTEFKTNLCVDHDHKTMEVRGILCPYCNQRVIGRHRDPELFERAAKYLRGPFQGIYANSLKRKRRKKKKNNNRKRRG